MDSACGRLGDTAENLEQGGFAGPVASDDADDLALLDFQVHIAQSPEGFGGGRSEGGGRRSEVRLWRWGAAIAVRSVRACGLAKPAPRRQRGVLQDMPQTVIFGSLATNFVALREVFDGNDGVGHREMRSAECGTGNAECETLNKDQRGDFAVLPLATKIARSSLISVGSITGRANLFVWSFRVCLDGVVPVKLPIERSIAKESE
jgi:hypothetical protein